MQFNIHPASALLKALPILLAFTFLSSASFSQDEKEAESVFVLKGNTKLASGKNIEGVQIELRKDGQVLEKIFSGKNGRYLISLDISILNPKSEYIVYITYPGTIPKSLSINTYISKEEYKQNKFPRYEFTLEIVMTETTVKDIVIEKPSGKIRWEVEKHEFLFDQVYAKIAKAEADKMKDESYLRELAEKKKKEEDEAARKKAEDDAAAKAKADADAKAKAEADARAKADAERILKENLEAMKLEIRKKRMRDSLDSLANLRAGKTNVEINRMSRPVSPDDVDPNAFDGSSAYAINIAKRALKANQEKKNREKARNLSAKYETNNTLTSLLNMVDEHDKNIKFKVKSQTP